MSITSPTKRKFRLHTEQTYQDYDLQQQHGELVSNILDCLLKTIETATQAYARVMAIRLDLRVPADRSPDDTGIITRFIRSLNAQIEADQLRKKAKGQRSYSCRVRYVWVREIVEGANPHYHVLLLLNRDAYFCLGDFEEVEGNLAARIRKAWASALGASYEEALPHVHFPKDGVYHIDRNDPEFVNQKNAVFHRASYFAKLSTKLLTSNRHVFGCSRD